MGGMTRPALKLQAAGAMLALLIGWTSAPVALAAAPLDVCSMPCCISEGHCCCTPRHAHVVGESPDNSDSIDSPQLSRSCPDGCATNSFFVSFSLRNLVPPAGHNVVLSPYASRSGSQPVVAFDVIAAGSSSPRAPPFLPAP